MAEVKITARNFSYGAKIYGTNGVYTVDDRTAKYIVDSGKGVLTKGKLSELQVEAQIGTFDILGFIKTNAKEILQILQEADSATGEPAAKTEEKVEDTANTANESDETSETSETESAETKDEEDASSEDGELPEGFPGRDLLMAAGINTVAKVPTNKEALMEIDGIGARLANQIGVKLSIG